MADTNWAAVLLDGSVGAVIGTLGAFGAALYVVRRQFRLERALAIEERQNTACLVLIPVFSRLERELKALEYLLNHPRRQIPERVKGIRELMDDHETLASAVDGVEPGYLNMSMVFGWTEEAYDDPEEKEHALDGVTEALANLRDARDALNKQYWEFHS